MALQGHSRRGSNGGTRVVWSLLLCCGYDHEPKATLLIILPTAVLKVMIYGLGFGDGRIYGRGPRDC